MLLACGLSLALSGCIGSSRAARFYTLAPLEGPAGRDHARAGATLAVGPVEIPEYVDRQQIVTRAGEPPIFSRETTVTEPVDGAGYDALIAAMQRALARFGDEVAAGILASTEVATAP
jgi:uncharacterized lipoprotein YmbA